MELWDPPFLGSGSSTPPPLRAVGRHSHPPLLSSLSSLPRRCANCRVRAQGHGHLDVPASRPERGPGDWQPGDGAALGTEECSGSWQGQWVVSTDTGPAQGAHESMGRGSHLDLATVSKRKEDLVLAFTAEHTRQRGKPGAQGRLS